MQNRLAELITLELIIRETSQKLHMFLWPPSPVEYYKFLFKN